jgi:hypothetical protein
MINAQKFKDSTLSEKFEIINQKGKYLGVREYYNHFINLYIVDETFIEVWYFPAENKIVNIDIIEDEKKLDLFIDYMNKLEKRT